MADPEFVRHARAIGLLLGIFVAPAVVLFARDLLRRHAERRSGTGPVNRRLHAKTPPLVWAWIALAIAACLVRSWAVFFFGSILLALVAYAYHHYSGREDRAFPRRANEGDIKGAIGDLRRLIEAQGPSARRSNLLGLLLGLQGRWQDAYKSFLDAEDQGGRNAQYLSNQGIALLQMGHTPEAASALEEVCEAYPQDVNKRLNLCSALISLGRREEAAGHLMRVERELKNTWTLIGEQWRQAVDQQIVDCRKRLAMPPGKNGPHDHW